MEEKKTEQGTQQIHVCRLYLLARLYHGRESQVILSLYLRCTFRDINSCSAVDIAFVYELVVLSICIFRSDVKHVFPRGK